MPTQKSCRKQGKLLNKVTGNCRRKCHRGKEVISPSSGLCSPRKSKTNRAKCREEGKMLNKVTGQCRRKCFRGKEIISPESGKCVSRKRKNKKKRTSASRSRSRSRSRSPSKSRSARKSQSKKNSSNEEHELSEQEELELDMEDDSGQTPLIRRHRIEERQRTAKKAQKKFQRLYGKNGTDELPEGFTVTKLIGSGSYGTIWKICDEKTFSDCNYVVKIEKKVKSLGKRKMKEEFKVQKLFNEKGLTIKPIDQVFFKKGRREFSMILMERVDGTLYDWLKQERSETELKRVFKQLMELQKKIKRSGFTHGDFHESNIGYNLEIKNGRFQPVFFPIDFGFSTTKGNFKDIDLFQLYRVLILFVEPGQNIHNKNARFLAKLIKPILLKRFTKKQLSKSKIDEFFINDFFRKYEDYLFND